MAYTAEHKAVAGREGAVPAVLGVLRRPAASPSLLERACGALRNLACDSDNAAEAGREGGIEACLPNPPPLPHTTPASRRLHHLPASGSFISLPRAPFPARARVAC